jgi:hypothetical protein
MRNDRATGKTQVVSDGDSAKVFDERSTRDERAATDNIAVSERDTTCHTAHENAERVGDPSRDRATARNQDFVHVTVTDGGAM